MAPDSGIVWAAIAAFATPTSPATTIAMHIVVRPDTDPRFISSFFCF